MASTKCFLSCETLQILLMFSTLCQGEINITEYLRMPALFKYDNYHHCVNRDEVEPKYPAKYCMVFVQIQPDNESTVWQQIELMNAEKYNYRHNYIYRGLCMNKCKVFINKTDTHENVSNGLLTSEQTQMFQQFYNNTLDRIMRYYQKEIHVCVNREYVQDYNLSTKTFVNYCINPQQSREKDIYFHLTILLVICFVLLNVISSLYDAKLKSQLPKNENDENNYYEVNHNNQVDRFLTSFSLYRNYKRLALPNKNDIGRDLSFLDGFRAILSFLIVCEHTFMVQYFHLENTEFMENVWLELVPRIFIHALIWLELFFVLSGLLMYVKFDKMEYITPKSSLMDCVNVFVCLFVSRYLRYLPSLIFLIIIAANLGCYQVDNSVGRNILSGACVACRDTWWQNILMINNYYMKNSCLMHTWYIAADFQLYVFFIIILIIMAKYPKSKEALLIGVAIVAAVINFGVNYVLKLDSIFMLLPESYQFYYLRNIETSIHLYFSSYTNINSFLLGIVSGLIYMKHLRKNIQNKNLLGKILQYSPFVGWTCILSILYLGTTIMMHKETTIWTAAYGLIHRHVGLTIVVVIVILRGMCNEAGFLKSSPFRYLARISFQLYLWQMGVLFFLFSYFNEPIHISYVMLYMIAIFLYVSTIFVSFVVTLCVEYPIAEIISIIDIEKKIKSS